MTSLSTMIFSIRRVLLSSLIFMAACSSSPLPIPEFSTSDIEIAEPDLGEPYGEPIVITPNLKKGTRIRLRSIRRGIGVYSKKLRETTSSLTPRKQTDIEYSGEFFVLEETGGVPSRIEGRWSDSQNFRRGRGEAWMNKRKEIRVKGNDFAIVKEWLEELATPHESLPEKVKPLKVGDSWTKDLNTSWTTESRLLAVGKKNGRVFAKIKTVHKPREKIQFYRMSGVHTVVFDVELGLPIYERIEDTMQTWGDSGSASSKSLKYKIMKVAAN